MKTKMLAWVALATLIGAGTFAYADNQSGTGMISRLTNASSTKHMMKSSYLNDEGGKMRGGMRGYESKLTDAEKTKLLTMTDIEKKAFFEAKMTEQKALHDAKEGVIDKLINGETLSDTEKATLAIIKTERAQKKAEKAAREAQMTEMKPILEKVKAGTTLTTEEQTKFDAFKATKKSEMGHSKGGKREGMGR